MDTITESLVYPVKGLIYKGEDDELLEVSADFKSLEDCYFHLLDDLGDYDFENDPVDVFPNAIRMEDGLELPFIWVYFHYTFIKNRATEADLFNTLMTHISY